MSVPLKMTPMLQQYLEIKNCHQDAILFYRLGDFYEMFFDDAVTASKVLGITLTTRNNKDEANKIPLCGVPYHAVSGYLAKMVKAGFKVAICEQMEDPSEAKGVVKREVVRVVTPGLVTEEQLLDDKTNRYIAAVAKKDIWGIALLDITTGEFLIGERESAGQIAEELTRLAPAELLLSEALADSDRTTLLKALGLADETLCITTRANDHFYPETCRALLLEHFKTANLAGFGCDGMETGLAAAGCLLQYIQETQRTGLAHIEKLSTLNIDDVLIIDDSSRRNLEIIQTIIGGVRKGSLLDTIDCTQTPMGARLLKKSLLFPSTNARAISTKLDTVAHLFADGPLRRELQELLARVYDLERLTSRVVLGSANARDLTALKTSLAQLPAIQTALSGSPHLLNEIHDNLDTLADLTELLETAIREDAPVSLREGNIIKAGYHSGLDELLSLLTDGKSLILGLEESERARAGIPNLKIGFNRVFGYFFEISKGQLAKAPDYFTRKQTLANAERFITPELKEFEEKVLGAEEKRLALEYSLFCEVRDQVAAASSRLLTAAALVAQIDLFCCLAEVARRNNYVRPEINTSDAIHITEGRHPVIERSLPPGKFVPNDILLDHETQTIMIITGPNMAGKSTVLRQTAIIVLMAQVGSFVPAAAAEIGIVDRIFTRVGAMDDLRKAQSTFMVEMNETANILNNATTKSLVILDEIGRGTSTFDGLSIAWAVTEDLAAREGRGVKTIFATHYHELTDLARVFEKVKNCNIAVREWNDTIIFLHKLMPGGTNRSYGIQVASLAGVPPRVIVRAKEILHNIERGEFTREGTPRIATGKPQGPGPKHRPAQLSLFAPEEDPVVTAISTLTLDRLSPLEALTKLYELKAMVEGRQ